MNVISLCPPYLGGFQEHFKLCPALVKEQVYAWVIASSFVMLLEAPQYGGRHVLKTELVYRDMQLKYLKVEKWLNNIFNMR